MEKNLYKMLFSQWRQIKKSLVTKRKVLQPQLLFLRIDHNRFKCEWFNYINQNQIAKMDKKWESIVQ